MLRLLQHLQSYKVALAVCKYDFWRRKIVASFIGLRPILLARSRYGCGRTGAVNTWKQATGRFGCPRTLDAIGPRLISQNPGLSVLAVMQDGIFHGQIMGVWRARVLKHVQATFPVARGRSGERERENLFTPTLLLGGRPWIPFGPLRDEE